MTLIFHIFDILKYMRVFGGMWGYMEVYDSIWTYMQVYPLKYTSIYSVVVCTHSSMWTEVRPAPIQTRPRAHLEEASAQPVTEETTARMRHTSIDEA